MELGESKNNGSRSDGVSVVSHVVRSLKQALTVTRLADHPEIPGTNIFKLLQLLKIFPSCGERNSSRVTLASTNLCNG